MGHSDRRLLAYASLLGWGAWLGVTLAAAGSLTHSSWRPFTNHTVLVTLGMGKGEVLLKAGRPDFQEVISHGTDGAQTVTQWMYIKTGHNAATATLTFRGHKLVRIETTLIQP